MMGYVALAQMVYPQALKAWLQTDRAPYGSQLAPVNGKSQDTFAVGRERAGGATPAAIEPGIDGAVGVRLQRTAEAGSSQP
jgi:hypothetical protein